MSEDLKKFREHHTDFILVGGFIRYYVPRFTHVPRFTPMSPDSPRFRSSEIVGQADGDSFEREHLSREERQRGKIGKKR